MTIASLYNFPAIVRTAEQEGVGGVLDAIDELSTESYAALRLAVALAAPSAGAETIEAAIDLDGAPVGHAAILEALISSPASAKVSIVREFHAPDDVLAFMEWLAESSDADAVQVDRIVSAARAAGWSAPSADDVWAE